MTKIPSFQFYPRDWLTDANLRRCTPLARSVWMDLLCIMWECDIRGVLTTDGQAWSDDEIATAVPGDTYKNMLALQELLRNRVAKRNQIGAVYSKRMVEDEENRQKWRNDKHRQRVHRDVHQDVQPMSGPSSSSSSSSTSTSNTKAEEDTAAAFLAIGFDRPFGHVAFKDVWLSVWAGRVGNQWVTELMEQTIQTCQTHNIKVPPQFYDAKHDVEQRELSGYKLKNQRPPL